MITISPAVLGSPTVAQVLRFNSPAITTGSITIDQLLGNFLSAPHVFTHLSLLSYRPTFGTNQDDLLWGTAGNDLIWGLNGNDTIETLTGDDIVDGGNGDDSINAGFGQDIVWGGNGDDWLQAEGSGFLFGGNGNDLVLGGTNASFEEVSGGAGADTIRIGQSSLIEADGTGISKSVRGDDGDDVMAVFNAEQISGGRGQDSISGGTGFPIRFGPPAPLNALVVVSGDGGDDVITYDLGNALPDSFMSGGWGNDILQGVGRLNGDGGSDRITVEPNFSAPNAPLSVGDGGSGEDWLIATVSGSKILVGGDGADTLSGSFDQLSFDPSAIDSMTGGTGRDTFILGDATGVFYADADPTTSGDEPGSVGYTVITDFNRRQDTIQLKGSPNRYRLDFFTESGISKAKLFYLQAKALPERIAILDNVQPDLMLTGGYFSYV